MVLLTHRRIPGAKFLPARHLGVVSEHGNYFTYKVWTLPDDKWENGRELVRKIVTIQQHTDTSPRIDYTDKALTMSKNHCAEKSKRKRKSKNTEVLNTAIASQKRIKSCETVNNEDTADSNADDRRHTAIRFSSFLVTERTDTGEKGENRSNITDNNPPTKTNQITKALEVPVGGKISHEDERDSDDYSAEEEDGYYKPLQDNNITMIPKINDALSSGRKEVRVSGAMLTNITRRKMEGRKTDSQGPMG